MNYTLLELLWGGNAILLTWLLRQYFALHSDFKALQITIIKDYAPSLEVNKVIDGQKEMLKLINDIRVDVATLRGSYEKTN